MTGHSVPNTKLRQTVLKGSVWLFGAYALSRVSRLAMMLILAAVLSPEGYGIIGLSAVIISAAQLTTEFGIWQAVVHRSEPDERYLDTAFTANVFVGIAVSAGLLLSAPWIAGFFEYSEMTGVLRVMALAIVADAIFYVPDGLLRKELNFKGRALPEIAGAFGSALATITLLLFGVGVLSYAVGFVVDSFTRCILTFAKVPWRPKLRIHRSILRDITSYGGQIAGADLTRLFSSNVDYIIVGRVLGAGPLGIYTLAFNLANYPVTNFTFILSRIAFPTFAKLKDDPNYARRAYLKMIRLVAALVAPLLVMLALLADPLILVLLGDEWRPAIFPLQVLVVAGISRCLSYPGSDMLRATGFPSVPFKISLLQALMISGALLAVASRGIETVAITVAVILSLTSWMITVATCRKFGVGLRELGRALSPAVALSASGASAIVLLKALDLGTLPNALELALLPAAAAIAMIACLATVRRDFFREVVMLAGLVKPR